MRLSDFTRLPAEEREKVFTTVMKRVSVTQENTLLKARLKAAQSHIHELIALVEWWAPKDGVRRTDEARQFVGAEING